MSSFDHERDAISRVGVIGAGLMGSGIAEVSAASGLDTLLVKATPGDIAPVQDRIARAFERRVAKGSLSAAERDEAMSHLEVTGDRDALLRDEIVIESIVEDVGEKRTLFADLAQRVGPNTIFASNTSTLKLDDLMAPAYGDRLVAMHFFSPVPAMKLVEIAHLPSTPPEVVRVACEMVSTLGKTAIPVANSAGFIVNRLLVPTLTGAAAAFANGLAGVTEIDTAMKLGCNHPLGPLALCDLIGLDVVLAMSKVLFRQFGDDRFRPPAILRRMVQDGMLGRKTRLGFYDYSVTPPIANPALDALVCREQDLGSAA